MGLFKSIFKSDIDPKPQLTIQFGRFSDSHKAADNYDAWDAALKLHEQEEYMLSYERFFRYIVDPKIDSVTYTEKGGKWHFQLYQGSKLITGTADYQKIVAEAKVASMQESHLGVLRKLLEDNFELKYSRYALDGEQNIVLTFSSSSLDASPYKLYHALKELGTAADKTDDILIAKHEGLLPINTHHVRDIPRKEKDIKYDFLTTAIDQCYEALKNTNLNILKHPGAVSYAYLDLIFKLDYLLKPEGYTMDAVIRINNLFFKDNAQPLEDKNRRIRHELDKIRELSATDFHRELYEVRSTFGHTTPSGPNRIKEYIVSELKNMDWYHNEGHQYFSLAIPSYIVGYSLYNYAMPQPLRRLLHLFYKVIEYPYFIALGSTVEYVKDDLSLHKKNIKKAISSICEDAADDYTELQPNMQQIQFGDIHAFAKSYLLLIADLDFTRKDER